MLEIGPDAETADPLRKRSIALAGHRTSIALEVPFWDALESIAAAEGRSLQGLIAEVDDLRLKLTPAPGLASALRVFVLERISADRREGRTS